MAGSFGLYILGGLIVVAIVALIFYKVKSGRADRAESRGRADKIEKERVEEVDRVESRRRKDKIEEENKRK